LPLLSCQPNGLALKRNSVSGTPTTPSIITAGGSIALSPTNTSPPAADQPGPKPHLDTGGLLARGSVVKNNGELWAVNCVNKDGRAAIRWYRINESNNTLIENGYIADPSLNFMYPSIAVNDLGDVVIGMSGTDPGTYASAFAVVGKTAGPGAGTTTFGSPLVTQAGVSDYGPLDGNRWGDYSATTSDPADPSIFWTIQEYVHATDERATQATEIILPQSGEVRWKDPANGVFDANASWLAGAVPGASDHVIFSRATDPGGSGYTVYFASDKSVDRLSVRQGGLTLGLDFSTFSATNPSSVTPSIAVGEFGGTSTLRVTIGTLAGMHATIAASPSSSGTINLDEATLSLQGNLNVGGTDTAAGGDAILNVGIASKLQVAQTLRVWNHGVVNFNDGAMSTGPLVVNGGRVNLAAGGNTKVLRTTDVQISAGGRIDLTDNRLIVAGGNVGAITALIASGRNGGAWNGDGIVSSAAAGGSLTSLGIATAAQAKGISLTDTALWSGQTVTGGDTLVMYTYSGDATLDGKLNVDDYGRIDSNIGLGTSGWYNGDFNYDGKVNVDDYGIIDSNIGVQGPPFSTAVAPTAPAASITSVPEPVALPLLALVAVVAPRRRRRIVRPFAPAHALSALGDLPFSFAELPTS
jgi:hypothetical protein